ncbi:MAG: amidohydrolase [Dehalococcoidia bacterium]|nr:amidohydrolase [Dehalococcoidia bacterium]
MSRRTDTLEFLDGNREKLVSLAKDIWEHPQTGFKETYASDLIAKTLGEAGFRMQRPVAGIPTAFVAEWGQGSPVIGVLGEYDALPGLSQKVSAVKEPVVEGDAGHGCGHNLLGVGGLGAALAVKHAVESSGASGTILYFGCPAEETLMGKVFMAREGLFDGLDACVTWHPMFANTIWASASTAVNSFKLSFQGVTAHAAAAPEAGRSALDAVMLTDVGVNFMREHMPTDVRVHCVVTNGGLAPNIVPEFAQSWYYVRAPGRALVKQVYERVLNVARGAAMMTETRLEVQLVAACHDVLPNRAIGDVLLRSMKQVGPPEFDSADTAFAEQLKGTLPAGMADDAMKKLGLPRDKVGDPLCTAVLDEVASMARGVVEPVSTDVGDVSYITPTAELVACCFPLGVPLHSWQATASSGSQIGFKGMMFAAKTLALTVLELLDSPETLRVAREELDAATGGKPYACPLPGELKPVVD